MKALIIKDFLNLRSSFKQIFSSALVFIGLGLFLKKPFYIYSLVSVMSLSYPLSFFSYDEKADFYSYGLGLPLSRRQLVGARYISSFAILALSMGLIFLANIGLIVPRMGLSLLESIASLLAISLSAALILSILLPLAFRFGAEASRRMLSLVVLAIFGLMALLATRLLGFFEVQELEVLIPRLLVILPFLVAGLIFISLRVSLRLVEKMDF